jgi:hypothetical protein
LTRQQTLCRSQALLGNARGTKLRFGGNSEAACSGMLGREFTAGDRVNGKANAQYDHD